MLVKHHTSSPSFIYFCVLINFSICIFNILDVGVAASQEIRCPVTCLYQLGDSISDTGNSIRIFPYAAAALQRPYGDTFPGYPTGRWSDGRLIIDYIAMALGLPLLNPYLPKNGSIVDNGTDFAVGGSATLDSSFLLAKGIVPHPVPSLTIQLSWFKEYLKSAFSTLTERADTLSKSLVFVGETGYNDIALSITQGRPVEEIYTYMPLVVQVIIYTAREVIKSGATQVVVPGTFPLGCFPWALHDLVSYDPTSYDETGCLKSVNNLTSFMNQLLQEALDSLRTEFPNVIILYADYYNVFLSLLRKAPSLGFDATVLLKPCCGEGTYNYLSLKFCGNPYYSVCPNPNTYIHWDGIHLTQEAYRYMSEILIKDLKINCTQ